MKILGTGLTMKQLKKLAFDGGTLPKNAAPSERIYYLEIRLITLMRERSFLTQEQCTEKASQAQADYDEYQLHEKICNANFDRYLAVYRMLGGRKPDCPVCAELFDRITGLKPDVFWEEGGEVLEIEM